MFSLSAMLQTNPRIEPFPVLNARPVLLANWRKPVLTETERLSQAIHDALHGLGGNAEARRVAEAVGMSLEQLSQAARLLVTTGRMFTYGRKGNRQWLLAPVKEHVNSWGLK